MISELQLVDSLHSFLHTGKIAPGMTIEMIVKAMFCACTVLSNLGYTKKSIASLVDDYVIDVHSAQRLARAAYKRAKMKNRKRAIQISLCNIESAFAILRGDPKIADTSSQSKPKQKQTGTGTETETGTEGTGTGTGSDQPSSTEGADYGPWPLRVTVGFLLGTYLGFPIAHYLNPSATIDELQNVSSAGFVHLYREFMHDRKSTTPLQAVTKVAQKALAGTVAAQVTFWIALLTYAFFDKELVSVQSGREVLDKLARRVGVSPDTTVYSFMTSDSMFAKATMQYIETINRLFNSEKPAISKYIFPITAAFFEESLFRGTLQRVLEYFSSFLVHPLTNIVFSLVSAMPFSTNTGSIEKGVHVVLTIIATIVQATMFSLFHMTNVLVGMDKKATDMQMIFCLPLGIIFTMMNKQFGWFANITAHAVHNFLAVSIIK